jgi:hypothetical protein
MSAERFVGITPVYDGLTEDDQAMVHVDDMVRSQWHEAVTEAGGRPVGEPDITHEPNPNYGRALTDGRGLPVCNDDGEPITDHAKLYVCARGWAER